MLIKRRQQGLSLVELMITVVLAMIVVLGGTRLYVAIVNSSMDNFERNRLTEEMRTLVVLISREARRAGFWQADMGTDAVWNNPFTVANTTDLRIGEMSGQATDSCMLYSYDNDTDGAVGAAEYYGVRLNGTTVQAANDASDCDTGTWATLTTPELAITTLSFTLQESCLDVATEATETCPCNSGDSCQHVRSVDLLAAGALTKDANVTEALLETIKIRNDKFVLTVP